MIALVGTILTGFLGNVEDVTTTTTDWTYYTDVAGAFDSDESDIYSDFNPASNVTGWSTQQDYNDRYISGVGYSTSYPNEFYVYSQPASPQMVSLAVTPDKANVQAGPAVSPTAGSYTIAGALGGTQWTDSGTINQYQGYNGSSRVTITEGLADGMVRVSVQDIIDSITPNVTASGQIVLEILGEHGSRFISSAANQDPQYRAYISDQTVFKYYSPVYDSLRVVYDPNTNLVDMGSAKYNAAAVSLTWVCNEYGETTNNPVSINAIINGDAVSSYVNAAEGVTPQPTTVTTSRVVTAEYGADEISITLGPVSGQGDGSREYNLSSISFAASNGAPVLEIGGLSCTYLDGALVWTWTVGGTVTTVSSTSQLTIVVDSDGYTVGSVRTDSSLDPVWSFSILADDAISSPIGWYDFTCEGVVSDEIEIELESGAATCRTSATLSTIVSESETYLDAFWNNNYSNQALSLVFKRPASDVTQAIVFYGPSGALGSMTVAYDGQWRITTQDGGIFEASSIGMGDWPAIRLTLDLGSGGLYIELMDRFTNFTDYNVMTSPQLVSDTTVGGVITSVGFSGLGTIDGDTVTASPSFTLSVEGTRILIPGGGAYMVNATIDTGTAFGDLVDDKAVQISLDSFIRIGSSVTANGTTFEVNSIAQTITIGGVTSPLPRTAFVHIPAEFSGFYYRGATYDAGHVYLIDSRLNVHDLGEADSLMLTLNGLWLTTANMSLGETEITTTTQWAGSVWDADKDTTVILFIGILLVAAIAMRWKFDASLIDLLIIGGAVVFSLMILG